MHLQETVEALETSCRACDEFAQQLQVLLHYNSPGEDGVELFSGILQTLKKTLKKKKAYKQQTQNYEEIVQSMNGHIVKLEMEVDKLSRENNYMNNSVLTDYQKNIEEIQLQLVRRNQE